MNSLSSFDQVLSRLRTEFAGVKLLALGQTIYWDEPMKAILRRLLDEHFPEAEMVVGIHDADYFSKVPASLNLADAWAILPHNDGATRDLWVATGEISRLFGSETVPTKDLLAGYGVHLDKIAKDFPGGRDALIETATEAWGWRGLAHAGSGNETACCVPLRDALPSLIELLRWGFSHTLDSLSESSVAEKGRRTADELIAEVRAYADSRPDAFVADVYLHLLPKFYERLLGYKPANLALTRASELFKFNKTTAGLPRFDLLRAFLDPKTKQACQESYDLAVAGSDSYRLDRFCPGAIPFDLAVEGKGRGTICLLDGEMTINFDEPVSIPVDSPPTTPEELADLVESRFGTGAALIGKALTLILMIASEFIFVLHEQASAYVPRCEKMAALMKERGVSLPFHPILRINHHTWDSLAACEVTFELPGHLAAAFRQGEITSVEFADSWQAAVREQEELLERISRISNLDELLAFLAERQAEPWPERIEAYISAYATLRGISERTEPMKAESVRLRDLSHRIKQEIQQLDLQKGEHFRSKIKPLMDESRNLSGAAELRAHEEERSRIERAIEEKRRDAADAHNKSLALKHSVRSLERGEEAVKARETLRLVEYEAETARLWLVRDAILVTRGLTYTNHRPSAWWFILADPELKWFNRVAETVEFRFEEIDSCE